MVCRMPYLCLGPGCYSLIGHSAWTLTVPLRLGVTPPPRRAPVCWHLKKPNSTQQWNMSAARGGEEGSRLVRRVKEAERERERKYVVVKKKEKVRKIMKEIPHTLQDEGDEFQSCSLPPSLSLPPSFSVCWPEQLRLLSAGLWLESTVRENLFLIWAFPVNAGNGPPHKAQLVRSHRGATALFSLLFPLCSLQYHSNPKEQEWTLKRWVMESYALNPALGKSEVVCVWDVQMISIFLAFHFSFISSHNQLWKLKDFYSPLILYILQTNVNELKTKGLGAWDLVNSLSFWMADIQLPGARLKC